MRSTTSLLILTLALAGCPRPRPAVVVPPTKDAGIETPVPDVDVREARLRPRKRHAPLKFTAEESANVGNGEDCTVYCATMFGRGIGVTCHPWLDVRGACHGMCYYENGYVVDTQTGQAHWRAGSGDLRPNLTEVPPFGYCTENGCSEDTWLECPWKGRGATPMIQEFCLAMARSEYHEGYNFCGQAP